MIMQLLESGEMYLETILSLILRDQVVCPIAVAEYVNYSNHLVNCEQN